HHAAADAGCLYGLNTQHEPRASARGLSLSGLTRPSGTYLNAGRRVCHVIRGMLLGPSTKLLSCRATSWDESSIFARPPPAASGHVRPDDLEAFPSDERCRAGPLFTYAAPAMLACSASSKGRATRCTVLGFTSNLAAARPRRSTFQAITTSNWHLGA